MRVFISARFFSPFFFSLLSFLEFSCVFSKREKRSGIDLRRTRADQVCLTKSSECFRSVVSRYHEICMKAGSGGRTPAANSRHVGFSGNFPHLQCSQAIYHQIKFGGAKPDDLHDSLSFSTKAHFQAFTSLPYAK